MRSVPPSYKGKKKPMVLEENCTPVHDLGCWFWNRATNNQGYGMVRRDGNLRLAHRVAYEEYIGPIPQGMKVLHKCDIRSCINPRHMFLGTQLDNIRDMYRKGRSASQQLSKGAS